MSFGADVDPTDMAGEIGEAVPVVPIQDCDFMGSKRLEFLLQALHHENDAGRSLRKYIEKSGRQVRTMLQYFVVFVGSKKHLNGGHQHSGTVLQNVT